MGLETIFYYTCSRMAHIYITSSTWYFGLKDKSEEHLGIHDHLSGFLFQRNLDLIGAGAKWIFRANGESGPYQILRDQGGHLLDWEECCRLILNIWQLQLDSALRAWKWNGHILKQMTLIKFRYVGRRKYKWELYINIIDKYNIKSYI